MLRWTRKKRKIEDFRLSQEAMELLRDFQANPRFYIRWLFHANDRLLEEAIENNDCCRENLQCMYALKHIRDLLLTMQNGEDIFDVENDG